MGPRRDDAAGSRRRAPRAIAAGLGLVGIGAVAGGVASTAASAGAATTTTSTTAPNTSSGYPAGHAPSPPAGAPPAGAPAPGIGPAGSLPLNGTVTAIGTSSVTIRTSTGTTTYAVDATSDIDKNGEATLSDLAVGDAVTFDTVTTNGTVTIDKLHAGNAQLDMPVGPAAGTIPPNPGSPPPSNGSSTPGA